MTTKIEWVARPGTTPETWNPVTGCSKVSEGCRHCYAERMARRLAGRFGYPADEPFKVTLHPDRLEKPLRWRKPRTVFVCSMGDLFHEDVPFAEVWEVWKVMRGCPQHTFQVLTKRPERMAEDVPMFYCAGERPLSNIWLGVTAENQATADERIPLLLQTPAAVRFVSCEPLLEAVDINFPVGPRDQRAGIPALKFVDWVIVGGESGPGARPMHPDSPRGLRDQCQAAGVPFFFKQHGTWLHNSQKPNHEKCKKDTFKYHQWGDDELDVSYRVGKACAGRLLDGRQWNEWPEAR